MKIRKAYWDRDAGLVIAVEGYDSVEFCFDIADVPDETTLKAKLKERIAVYEASLKPEPQPSEPSTPDISFYENLIGMGLKARK